MPFLKAGFNPNHRRIGILAWTRAVTGKRFEPARLIQFQAGDFAWLSLAERFLAWGESVVLGSHWGFELPWEYQNGLGHCDVDSHEEHAPWKWVEERRAQL